jgi:hypothetical protein
MLHAVPCLLGVRRASAWTTEEERPGWLMLLMLLLIEVR